MSKVGNTDFPQKKKKKKKKKKKNGPSMWFFDFKWYTIVASGNLWKRHGCEKSSSWVIIENAIRLHNFNISKIIEVESLLLACNRVSIKATVWSWCFSWVGQPGMPIMLWNNKSPISQERVVGFSQAYPKVLWNKSVIWI